MATAFVGFAIFLFVFVLVDSSTSKMPSTFGDVFDGGLGTERVHRPSRTPRKISRDVADVQQRIARDTEALEPKRHETTFVAECSLPSTFGDFRMRSYVYKSSYQNLEPIVMVHGNVEGEDIIVRVHDQCVTGEVFGSMRCDCREQLQGSLKTIEKEGGILIYLQQEGRGIGISNKIAAYSLQDEGLDTVDANLHLGFRDDLREYGAVPDILKDLGVKSIRLITNNPFKVEQLTSLGVQINSRISLEISPNRYNFRYLSSKRNRMRHVFHHNIVNKMDQFSSLSEHNNNGAGAETSSDSESTTDAEVVHGDGAAEKADTTSEEDEDAGVHTKVGYSFGRGSVEAAIEAIKAGKMVIVVDDADRENEGDFIMAGELATPESIGFIIRHSSGVLCTSLESERLEYLKLPPMVINNEDPKQTAYTVSVDCKHNTSTGISAADRAVTFRALANPLSTPDDFQRPGHVFPLRYKPGGVLARAGHTEASLDLARLAGLQPVGVLAEIVNDDGSLKRLPALKVMAEEFGLVLTSVQDLIAYRQDTGL